MTFRIAFMVEDKHLAQVLKSVSGFAHHLETQPVVAKPLNGSGTAGELFLAQLKAKTFTPKELQTFLPSIGASAKSVTTTIEGLKKLKLIRRKSQGLYQVLK